MNNKYYVNDREQSNGDHEVHREDCDYLPTLTNRRYLGVFSDCRDAVTEAKKVFRQVNGCKFCSRLCHTS
ncbi:hypothetical protein GS399_05065 [Pedobacter sp. HMF7647]|uniref:Uncharacterized protein n=1 Tax=Hufsiella arboris TaxID=2695275 RepID=A0A7K1Y6Z1_9SPHI|nr:hypothetical protein [Hufsiella arboris]MXV50334.1 hypothetical protein [Hufsiella arboris]